MKQQQLVTFVVGVLAAACDQSHVPTMTPATPRAVAAAVHSVKGGPWGIGRGVGGDLRLTQIDGNQVGRFTLAP